MSSDYAKALFYWRDHVTELSSQPKATIGTMLWTCERWIEVNASRIDAPERKRVLEIMAELQEWRAREV